MSSGDTTGQSEPANMVLPWLGRETQRLSVLTPHADLAKSFWPVRKLALPYRPSGRAVTWRRRV